MKKKLVFLLSAVLLLAAGYCIYQEVHFTSEAIVPADMNASEILEELPDIALTEHDKALRQALLALPQVRQGLDETRLGAPGALYEIPSSSVIGQLAPYLPEEQEQLELYVSMGKRIALSYFCGDVKTIIETTEDGSMIKSIAIYEQGDCKALYTNDNGTLQKLISKRIWFAWLRQDK